MPSILTQKQARSAQKLPFCYYCGQAFSNVPGRNNHPDHIPPGKLFAPEDRNFPLKLSCHQSCNNVLSDSDEIIGQLVSAAHETISPPEKLRLTFYVVETESGHQLPGVGGVNIEQQVIRWVRGFHAALYEEFLPQAPATQFLVSLPFPRLPSGAAGDTFTEGLLQHHVNFVAEIRNNRRVGRLDRIECNNGKCVYQCVWTNADGGEPVCIFALKLYDWAKLADSRDNRRSCVGLYYSPTRRPKWATEGLACANPVPLFEPLDAFAE
jgi:hypothetical protein